jgi:LPS-assembly protein
VALSGIARAADCGPTVTASPSGNPANPTTDLKAANDEQIVVESDGAQVTRAGDALLEGRVILRQAGRELSADHLEYHKESGDFAMRGNVDYRDGTVHVHGVAGNYDPAQGATIGTASFELPARPARGIADSITVKSSSRTELRKVQFTTCPLGNNDWKLNASRIDLDTARHSGSGRNVRLDFKGVPILFTPAISFPIGNERKSGFLFPGGGHSTRSGIEFSLPYYFNLAPNYDLTATPKLLSDRGVQLASEFRYLTGHQRGQVSVEYLANDKLAADELLTNRDRVLAKWNHIADFAQGWRARIDLANASDSRYFEDFAYDPAGTSITYLERTVALEYLDRNWSLLAELQNFQTIDQLIEPAARPYSTVPRIVVLRRRGSRQFRTQSGRARRAPRHRARGRPAPVPPRHVSHARARLALHALLPQGPQPGRAGEPRAQCTDRKPRRRAHLRARLRIARPADPDLRTAAALCLCAFP